jgi:predicted small lipoprotein YifL
MRTVISAVLLLGILFLTVLLPACGKRGPLYLPDDAAGHTAPAPDQH